MSLPQETWGHAAWIRYFREHMKRSVETDIRPLIATEGAFGIPRQFFPHIEYLSGLVFGPADGQNLGTTAHAERFLREYMKRADTLYETEASPLLAMWRHGVIHTYQPKVLETDGGKRRLGWLSYQGERKNQEIEPLPGTRMTVSHLTTHVGKGTLDHLPVANNLLVEDLEHVLETIANDIEAEQAAGRATHLKNMQRAARHLAKPVPEKKPAAPPSEEDLKKAVRFIRYEWDRFSWAAHMIKKSLMVGEEPGDWEAGTGGGDDTKKSLIEICVLHARALRDFLNRERGDQGVHKTDILAVDFIGSSDQWEKPSFDYLTDEMDRLNRALAHLSYERIKYLEESGTDWKFKLIFDEVEAAWRSFLDTLSEERRGWFAQEPFGL